VVDSEILFEVEMKHRLARFLWTWQFWAVIGVIGCGSGLVFQKLAGTGTELWCLGLCFFAAAYVERRAI
jgi:hypothetical protein